MPLARERGRSPGGTGDRQAFSPQLSKLAGPDREYGRAQYGRASAARRTTAVSGTAGTDTGNAAAAATDN